jgi:hypothetical protein
VLPEGVQGENSGAKELLDPVHRGTFSLG